MDWGVPDPLHCGIYMNYLSIMRFFINLTNKTYTVFLLYYMTLQWSLLINFIRNILVLLL